MKGIAEDVVLLALPKKIRHLLFGIRRVGVAHGRTRITEAPMWQKCRTARQPGKASGDIGDFGAGDEPVVEITVFRDKRAIETVIVAAFAAQIERAVGNSI